MNNKKNSYKSFLVNEFNGNHGSNGVVPILRYFRPFYVICIALTCLSLIACNNPSSEGMELEIYNEEEEKTQNEDVSNDEAIESNEIYVYVCGAVNNPDVYVLTNNDHIKDAVKMAGGFNDKADADYINLAAKVSDGMKIYIPEKGEILEGNENSYNDYSSQNITINEADMNNNTKGVNINTASLEELMSLPGIGEGKAAKIIEYRENNGPFKEIGEITLVNGIKDGAFNKIKDLICVG